MGCVENNNTQARLTPEEQSWEDSALPPPHLGLALGPEGHQIRRNGTHVILAGHGVGPGANTGSCTHTWREEMMRRKLNRQAFRK